MWKDSPAFQIFVLFGLVVATVALWKVLGAPVKKAISAGQAISGFIYFMGVVALLALLWFGFLYFLVLGSEFNPMPDIRLTRAWRRWAREIRAQKHMARQRLRGGIPAPGGREDWRDARLEALLCRGLLREAEEYLREKLESLHGQQGEEFRRYTFYLEYLLYLRGQRPNPPSTEAGGIE